MESFSVRRGCAVRAVRAPRRSFVRSYKINRLTVSEQQCRLMYNKSNSPKKLMIIKLDRFSDHPSLRGNVSDRTHLEFDTDSKDFTFCEQIGDRDDFVRTPVSIVSVTRNNMGEPFRQFVTANFQPITWMESSSFDFEIDQVAELRKHLSSGVFSDELNGRFA